MLADGRSFEDQAELSTDICIIGAGAAGITVARELANTNIDVVLLESGGTSVSVEGLQLASGESIGRLYHPLEASRLRMFGGSTGHWAGWCRPLDEIDFRKRDWIPHSGWPFERSELMPYYRRAQVLCDLGPFAYEPEAWSSLANTPWDFHGEDEDAAPKIVNRLIQFSPPTRFGEAYRQELEDAANVRVILNSSVQTLDAESHGRAIRTVSVRTLDGPGFRVAAKRFVLAAGGLENPRLLLLSDDVHKSGLGNERDLVGRYFMNHTWFEAGGLVTTSPELNAEFYRGRTEALTAAGADTPVRGFMTFSDEAQAEAGIANISLMPTPSSAKNVVVSTMENDAWYSRVGRAAGEIDEFFRSGFNSVRSKMSDGFDHNIYEFINVTEQVPNPDSRVTLADSTDAFGQRRVALDWQLNELDLVSVARGHRLFGAEAARLGIGRVIEAIDPEDGWPAGQIGDWHHMGTTRMGDTNSDSIVDANCRMHDIDNLFVAGSSVFPTSGYSNPTLTIVALSIRLADMLKQPPGSSDA
ncbi:MAG: GMC family oxidoreductase [Pseudomonadota bacterium]